MRGERKKEFPGLFLNKKTELEERPELQICCGEKNEKCPNFLNFPFGIYQGATEGSAMFGVTLTAQYSTFKYSRRHNTTRQGREELGKDSTRARSH